jgi:hypothetical protein
LRRREPELPELLPPPDEERPADEREPPPDEDERPEEALLDGGDERPEEALPEGGDERPEEAPPDDEGGRLEDEPELPDEEGRRFSSPLERVPLRVEGDPLLDPREVSAPSFERVEPLERVVLLDPERELAPLDTSRLPVDRVADEPSLERVVVRLDGLPSSPERVVERVPLSPERVVVRPVALDSPERVTVRVDEPLPDRVVVRVEPSSSTVRVVVRVEPRVDVPVPEPDRVTVRRSLSLPSSLRPLRPVVPRMEPEVGRRLEASRLPRPVVPPRGV